MPKIFGSDYDEKIDGPRLQTQIQIIRDAMLSASECNSWLTLHEIEKLTRYGQASISAQLRHLKRRENGSHILHKRRRSPSSGTWEYRLEKPAREQKGLF